MPSPAQATTRLLLIRRDTPAPPRPHAPKIRRYSLARLQVNTGLERPSGTAHLRRMYD